MAAQRKPDNEMYQAGTALAREVRATVAEQIAAVVVEADRLGSGAEAKAAIEAAVAHQSRAVRLLKRQDIYREMGLPVAVVVRAQREARDNLRTAAMNAAAAFALWCAAMDFEARRLELQRLENMRHGRRKQDETETI